MKESPISWPYLALHQHQGLCPQVGEGLDSKASSGESSAVGLSLSLPKVTQVILGTEEEMGQHLPW